MFKLINRGQDFVQVMLQATLEFIERGRLHQGIAPVGLEQLDNLDHIRTIDPAQVEAMIEASRPAESATESASPAEPPQQEPIEPFSS